ncbi:PAS domain-containing protein [Polyangium spumosum]|uniref:PAS domain-containing protein n=1 Tax=Polyangium spumosum TaxID=889282 RepID=A0A6N7PUB9_9BACT|nr:PAS domain-containing protein [Polyangium spumosum]MRG94396.1 PAS domain-containing protein [Polyangium spumosum]
MATLDGAPASFSIHPDLLLSVLDDATALVDARGRVRLTNPRMDRLFASEEGARFLPFFERQGAFRLLPTSVLEGAALAAARGIEDVLAGARERLELDLGAPGSSILAIACAVDGGRGALVRVRLRTAEEEHRARCAEVVEAMQLGLYVYRLEDSQGDEAALRCVYGNPAAEELTQRPTAKFVGKLLDEVSSVPRQRGLIDRYVEVVHQGKTVDIDYTTKDAKTGTDIAWAIKAFPLSGQCVGSIFEDVTKQRETEQSLRSTSQFLDTILDNLPMFIFIKDARDLRYIHTNRYMEQAFNFSWVGKNDHEIFPKEQADVFIQQDREILAGRVIVDIPEEVVPIGGLGVRICHTRKIPLYDEAGQPLFLIGMSEDITDRRSAEDAKRRELVLLETQTKLMELVRQLSTPLLPLAKGVLVAPLVGQMDEARGQHFMEALLAGIQDHQAETVLIDITGVPSIDASVAEQLLRATRAAGLLGTETALVGVSPDVARTIVDLGVDFGSLVTYADLRAGMRAAEEARRRRLVAKPPQGNGRPSPRT